LHHVQLHIAITVQNQVLTPWYIGKQLDDCNVL